MAARDSQAGRPSWSLSPQSLSVAYGQAQFMSSTGEANASGWFGPLRPLDPIAPPQVAGRQFDFPSGYNIAVSPRANEPISFHDLRALADAYDLLRLVIETRKDQIERMGWTLRPRAGCKGPGPARLAELTRFFERPDGEHSFAGWLRMLLEDLLVIDAPTLWKERARNGAIVALHPLDGATIKRVIDDWGRTPRPFVDSSGALIYPAAYQQVLKGYPAVDYAARDIIYAPRNLRTGRVYGYSPVEQIVMTANIALKRQIFTLSHFTEGNIPESLIGVPENWTPDQIKNFQDYWDAYFTGDLATRRRAKFVPGGVAKTFIQTKEPELKGVFDEWLARLVCYAFSVSHQAFVNQNNRSTGETQKEMAEEEGLWPILKWVKRLIDGVLNEDFGEEEIEFAWGEDAQIDAAKQAQVLTSYVDAGILTRNEARAKLGEAPVALAEADALTVTTGSGPVALGGENGAHALGKAYDPEQPRDWHGRFATQEGRGAKDPSRTPKPKGVQVAGDDAGAAMFLGLMGAAAAGVSAYQAVRNTLTSPSAPWNTTQPPFPSSPSSDDKGNLPPATVAQPKSPSAAAGAPAPDPNDPNKSQGQPDASSQRPKKPTYQIGASDGGPGKWVQATETMKPDAAAYQQKVTGAPQGRVYNVPNSQARFGVTSFDGYDPATDTLIDAKHWLEWPTDDYFSPLSVETQARSQIEAASGRKIVWKIASPDKAADVADILERRNIIGIDVEYFPP
jgi:hypothetical protein